MAIDMALWKVANEQLHKIDKAGLDSENRLENWIANDISLLDMNLMVIGRQVYTRFGGRIDLLAINQDGDIVVLELKRDRTPREIVAQVLDYATWVKQLSAKEIDDIAAKYLGESLATSFQKQFNSAIPETINNQHSMVIIASALDDASERIINYLANDYGVNINAIFFNFFKNDGVEFLGRSWLMNPQEVEQRSESKKSISWSGFWFVNVGDGQHRSWEDCVKYGFLSAGQGKIYSDPLKKLRIGDKVLAYMKQNGYVGYGIVNKEAVPVRDYYVEREGKKILELPLQQPGLSDNKDNDDLSEWLVGIEWVKTFPRNNPKWAKDLFANQNIVCKLRHQPTVDFLVKEFNIPE